MDWWPRDIRATASWYGIVRLGGTKAAGYQPGKDGYQLRAIVPRDGYDPKAVFSAPLLGKLVWGDFEYKGDQGKTLILSDTENTTNVSHFSRILSSEVTKIINVPVMSNSEANGIAGCLYNVTIPNIDNWRRFSEGSRFGATSIADIYADPMIGNKVVFNLMDGLIAQFAGGPQSEPNYAVHHATLYASKDPVALDVVALKKIGEWRARASVPAIGPGGLLYRGGGANGPGQNRRDFDRHQERGALTAGRQKA